MPGQGVFERCVEHVSERGGARSPRGVCAAAGRKKYGKRKFQQMAVAGKKRAQRNQGPSLDSALDQVLQFTPGGAALAALDQQRVKIQHKMDRERRKLAKGKKRNKAAKGGTIWSKGTVWQKKTKPNRKKRNLFGLGKKKVTAHYKRTKRTGQTVKDSYGERVIGFRRVKGNPRNPVDAAEARYESFHGRPSEELVEVTTPIHEHSVLSGIGELKKLVVVDSPAGGRVTISKFGHNKHGQPALLSMNEEATQLFIEGGDQSVNLEDFGISEPYHEIETLGSVRDVYYFTTKDHLGEDGGTATYHHRFGGLVNINGRRVRSRLPDLIYDTRNKLLMFSGGRYTLPDEGIDG